MNATRYLAGFVSLGKSLFSFITYTTGIITSKCVVKIRNTKAKRFGTQYVFKKLFFLPVKGLKLGNEEKPEEKARSKGSSLEIQACL